MKQLHNDAGTRVGGRGAASAELARRAMDQLFEVAVVLGEAMARGLGAHGLTTARAELIWRLHEAGPMTQRQLSQVLQCTPRNVTGLVDALEAAGFVGRGPHPTDRRATLVSLTQQGTAMATAWYAERQQGTAALFGDIPRDQLALFVATLEQVLAKFRADPAMQPGTGR